MDDTDGIDWTTEEDDADRYVEQLEELRVAVGELMKFGRANPTDAAKYHRKSEAWEKVRLAHLALDH